MLVKLQPYTQNIIAVRSSNKLVARYFGPFLILKRIGQVAYQLALPSTTCIHNVFHVSFLKPFRGMASDHTLPLSPEVVNCHPVFEPYGVLQER